LDLEYRVSENDCHYSYGGNIYTIVHPGRCDNVRECGLGLAEPADKTPSAKELCLHLAENRSTSKTLAIWRGSVMDDGGLGSMSGPGRLRKRTWRGTFARRATRRIVTWRVGLKFLCRYIYVHYTIIRYVLIGKKVVSPIYGLCYLFVGSIHLAAGEL